MQRTLPVGLLALAFLSPVVAVAAGGPVDARTLDIGGVKTGMDYDQALAAAAAHFHVPPNRITSKGDFEQPPSTIATCRSPCMGNPSIRYLGGDGEELWVHFVDRVPVDKAHPFVAYEIGYAIPYTPQNLAKMAEAAQAKYGVPTVSSSLTGMQWCANPSPNPGIACNTAGVAGQPPRQAVLMLPTNQVILTLTDPTWQDALENSRRDGANTKPNL